MKTLILSGLLAWGAVMNMNVFSDAAVEEHFVSSLPGLASELPSKHYSGLLPTGNLSSSPGHLHYWFIESTNDPTTDPVVLWLNGGPGSSSLIGLLTENGQIVLNDTSLEVLVDGVPQVFINEYAWTTVSNMIYLESPKGVGFSYCDDAKTSAGCVNTDDSTAQDSYEFLVNFFNLYPEYKSNKFYITGESYAGIYIPMLLEQLDNDVLGAGISVTGAAIGNGCWGNTVGTCDFSSGESLQIQVEFYHGHGMYSDALYDEINDACGDFDKVGVRCAAKLSQMAVQVGSFNGLCHSSRI